MKKIMVLVVLLFAATAFSQTLRLGIGPNLALPTGTFGDIASTGFGGTAQAEVGMLGYNLTGSIAYLSFGSKELVSTPGLTIKKTISAIPVMVGAKYTFPMGVYGAASLGLNFLTTQVDQTTHGLDASTTTNETKFGYAVGAGVQLLMLDVSVKYQTLATDANFFGLTVLYNIGL